MTSPKDRQAPVVQVNTGEQQPFAGLKDVPPGLIFRLHIWSKAIDLAGLSVKWGAIAFCAYQLPKIIEPMAGKTTSASFLLSMIQPDKIDSDFTWVWPTATFLVGIWAAIERILRYRKVRYLTDRISKLEQHIDPKRSSSGLAASGATHPRDE